MRSPGASAAAKAAGRAVKDAGGCVKAQGRVVSSILIANEGTREHAARASNAAALAAGATADQAAEVAGDSVAAAVLQACHRT